MKKILFSLLIFIILINLSYASLTITVKTIPNSIAELTLIEKTDSYVQILKKINKTIDKNGEAIFNLDDKLPKELDITVKIKQFSTVIINKKFTNQKTSDPISLIVFPEGFNNQNNNPPNSQIVKELNNTTNNTNITNISSNTIQKVDVPIEDKKEIASDIPIKRDNPAPLTGDVISQQNLKKNNSMKYLFYIIAVGIILGLVVFFVYKKNQDKSPPFQHHGRVVLKENSSPAIDVSEYKDKPVHQHEHNKYRSNNQEFLKLKSQRRMEDLKRRMAQDLEEFKRLSKDGH